MDECDRVLENMDMRRDVQEIFRMTPHEKQVMMFSATLSKEVRMSENGSSDCNSIKSNPCEELSDDECDMQLVMQ